MRGSCLLLALWSLFLAAVRVSADEFPVRIPSSFRTEVLIEIKYDGSFSPTQFLITEFQYNDVKNYRLLNIAASTVQRGSVEDGLNLACGQSETIVVDGQLLKQTRQSEFFQGEVPTSRESLVEMIEKQCRFAEWSVFFSARDDQRSSLAGPPGLDAIVGSLDFLNQDRSAFLIATPSRTNGGMVEANIQGKDVSSRVTLQKWEGGWRVTQLNATYSNPSMFTKYSIRENRSGLEMETYWTKTADQSESRSTTHMTNMQFGNVQTIELTQSIKNRAPVSLRGSPQIRAVWMDGKVVRLYKGGTVDDLGSATFRTTSE